MRAERELEKEQSEAAPGAMPLCGTPEPSTSSATRKARPRARGSTIYTHTRVSGKRLRRLGECHDVNRAYPLHAVVVVTGVVGGEVQGRRRLRAGQRDVVLAVQLHLPHHLGLEAAIEMAAVLQTLPPPSLGGVTVLAHPKPVGRAPAHKTAKV